MPGFKIGLRFLVANLHLYLLLPLAHSCEFPFLFANWNESRVLSPDWLPFAADHYLAEPTAGLLVTVPFLWLGLAALASAAISGWRAHGPGDGPGSGPAEVASRWRWVSRVLCISTLACAAPLLVMSYVSMRYEADFAAGLLLIAILSGWLLLSAPASRAGRGAACTLYAVLAAASVASGILLGFGGYFDHFDRHNPALMSQLRDALSICGAR
jgi:hypothetical protein